jgi:predicted transposase/invertase (TIGR01784 family)
LRLEFIRATKEEEFEMLAQRDPDIGLAVVNLKTLSQDERLRELAISREKLEWDMASREEGAEQRGLEKGREEVQRVFAKKALAEGLSVETVMAITGLSRVDLLQLQSENQTRH